MYSLCKMCCMFIVVSASSIAPADLQESGNKTSCGPLKVTLSEENSCYISGISVPCPNSSEAGTQILKICRPPYAESYFRRPNTTYTCRQNGTWGPSYDACQPDCGLSTASNKYPWIVAVYNADEELICSGSIITTYHFLSARECFTINYGTQTIVDPANYTIVAGKHYSNIHRKKKSAQVRKIKTSYIHSSFFPIFGINDLALIEVSEEFLFLDDVLPACLDWTNFYQATDYRDGNDAIAVGWEYNKDEVVPCNDSNDFNVQFWHIGTCGGNIPSLLSAPFIDNLICGTYINDQTSCGKGPGVGLFFKSTQSRYFLRGITGTEVQEGNVTYTFFTQISIFLDWLKERLKEHPRITPYRLSVDIFDSKISTGCRLPEHIKYGRFRLIVGNAYKVNIWVPTSTRILLFCRGSKNQIPTSIRCVLGEWQPAIDKLECKRPGTCPGLQSSSSEDILCSLSGQATDCANPVNNTTAVIRCKPFHAISGNRPIYKCQDGEWDQPFTPCTLECGIKREGVATLAVGASETIKNEYPWVVAIYKLTEHICGGTIISRSYVLSAAHCFTTFRGIVQNKDLYTIIAGKYFRNFTTEEESAQKRKIKSLTIHEDYKGSLQKFRDDIALIELDTQLIPTLEVQPACVDWDNVYEEFDFIDGNTGVVTGWGYTQQQGAASDTLKKLVLPFRSKDVCVANFPEEFGHQYVATDKICAGYKDNNMSVCNGDSGGGLYFKSPDGRFYVRGIVSLTVKTEFGGCEINNFALYTKVSKYRPWMESITRRVL